MDSKFNDLVLFHFIVLNNNCKYSISLFLGITFTRQMANAHGNVIFNAQF